MAKLNIDKTAFTMNEIDTVKSVRDEWAGVLDNESIRTAAQWLLRKMKAQASVLVSVESLTVTKVRGNATIWANVIMRGLDVFADVAFDFCAAVMENESAINSAYVQIFKRA